MLANVSDANQLWLTTGEAAELCSVQRDTVLKWIRRGRLEASRTAGGHFRIDRRSLQRFIPRPASNPQAIADIPSGLQTLHCWGFFGDQGRAREECRSCIALQAAAKWCFRLRQLAAQAGNSFCSGPDSCEDCAYYRQVAGLPARVLVITGDPRLKQELSRPDCDRLEIRVTSSGYAASAALADFHPSFILLDVELETESALALLRSLTDDNRLHGPRVILTTSPSPPPKSRALRTHEAVVGILGRPLSGRSLSAFIESIPTDRLESASVRQRTTYPETGDIIHIDQGA